MLYSVHFPDVNTGYAVGNIGTIVKTTDGGTTWNSQSSGTSYFLYSVYFPDTNIGYAVGGDPLGNFGNILKTTNGGTTWTGQLIGVPMYIILPFVRTEKLKKIVV